MKNQPITVWFSWNEKAKKFEHHHIEDGHSNQDIPVMFSSAQQSWVKQKWEKKWQFLDQDSKIVNEAES